MTQNDHIRELLDRFMNGQTSEAEEAQLAHYFRTASEVPGEWQVYQEMFASFDTDLYAFSEQELNAMATPATPVEHELSIARRRPSLPRRILRIAASVAVVAVIGLVGYKSMVAPNPVGTPARSPKLTARVTQPSKTVSHRVEPGACGQPETHPRKTSANRPALSGAAASEAAADLGQNTALPEPGPVEMADATNTVAASSGSYAEAEYAELLSQFASLRETTQMSEANETHLVASTSPQPSAIASDTPQAASTGSPFDGDVVFSKIDISFPTMQ